jgi:formylmethanofuran dehydrogenase subunit C
MRNPFQEFRSLPYERKELPLNRIVKGKEAVMAQILEGYLRLVEEEVKDLVWLVEHSRVVKAYTAAVKSIRDLHYDPDDIDEFCAELDSSNRIPYMISGPAGIYISALVNLSTEDRITLRLKDFQRTFHFLGYRLPEGKTLILQGDVGDFVGAGLSGGRLIVEGSTGNWCGAGMMKGEILVTEHAGQNTGEWMRGGEIHVDGRIRSIGKTLFGGRIYQRERLLAPQDLSGEI